jgi:hypothetical protein
MEHKKAAIVVYKTEDYKVFKLMDGNRGINKKKIERIIKEIQAGNDVLDESPILVTQSKHGLEIKDGQHRFMVAQQLKRPVHFIVKKQDMSILNVARVNSNTEKWSAQAFIHAYSKAGKEDYKKLGAFHKKYGIAVGTCLMLLTFGSERCPAGGHEVLAEQFQNGTFQIKNYKDAVLVAETCKSFEAFGAWNSRGFIQAVVKILQHSTCDFDKLKKKFQLKPGSLLVQSNWKGYAENLQRIYNYDNSKQQVIY